MIVKTYNLECTFSRFSGAPRRNSRTTGAPGPARGTYSVRNIYGETPPTPNSNPFTNSGVKVGQVRAAFFIFAVVLYIHVYTHI